MNFAVIVLFVVGLTLLQTSLIDATICKPLSKFRVDCDECQCSEDGTEYSCTMRNCGGSYKFPPPVFDKPFANDVVLQHKKSRLRTRNIKTEIPYINDEIPPSREETNEYLEDLVYDEWNPKVDTKTDEDKETLQDVSLEEQDASVFDPDISGSFRRKRYIKPHGKRFIRPLKPNGKRYVASPNEHGKRYVAPHPHGKRYVAPHPHGKRYVAPHPHGK